MVLQKVLQYVQISETTFMHFVFRMVALVLRMVWGLQAHEAGPPNRTRHVDDHRRRAPNAGAARTGALGDHGPHLEWRSAAHMAMAEQQERGDDAEHRDGERATGSERKSGHDETVPGKASRVGNAIATKA